MSGSSSTERRYQFISDPGHKENLSGRVGAACVTCRRKKIKCSGDVPCGTCREKGIECEGLTPRKRPRRLVDSEYARTSSLLRGERIQSGELDAPAPGRPSWKRSASRSSAEATTNVPDRPTTALLKLKTGMSNDSGYGSGEQTAQLDYVLSSSWQGNLAPTPSPMTTTEDSAPVSPTQYQDQDWSFMRWEQPSEGPPTETAESAISAPVSTHSASDLISAAEMLEMQAMSLRLLATQCPPPGVDGARRQTIDGAMYESGGLSSNLSPTIHPHSYDDLSPFLGVRGSGSGITPRAAEFNSWWNVDPTMPFSFGSNTTASEPRSARAGPTATVPSNPQWPISQTSTMTTQPLSKFLATHQGHSTDRHVSENSNNCRVLINECPGIDQPPIPFDKLDYNQT